jgi:holo-[acyl-carrier protein] synthase
MKSVGIDILEIERLREGVRRHGERFLKRLFTEKERGYCKRFRDPAPHLAARFAAKEAVSKALGVGFGASLSWQDVEVQNGPQGQPQVILSPAAQQRFHHPKLLLSITHSRQFACAVAFLS